jgi:crotonobetainyl-CoA:carnitine CoA-transferase CaiB-like acyl-CoA transferase
MPIYNTPNVRDDDQCPLSGMRVVELGGGYASAMAAHFLHGYGAHVVRIEVDAGADALRASAPLTDDQRRFLLHGIDVISVSVAQVLTMIADADLVVSDRQPAQLRVLGIRWSDFCREHPEIVVVSVTPFGLSGPNADLPATNAVVFASGGIMSLTGAPERSPLITGGDQGFALGGVNAFAAACTAWFGRLRHGAGDLVDISLQECATSMLEYYGAATSYLDTPGQLRLGNQTRATWGVYPCADGWVGVFALARQIPALFALIGDPELRDSRFADPLLRALPENEEELAAKLYVYLSGFTMAEMREQSLASKVPFGVIITPAELVAATTPADRGFWDEIPAEAGPIRVPGRPFPGLGWSNNVKAAPPKSVARDPLDRVAGTAGRLPLQGIRVLDLTMMWAGPFATLRLAEMGADVIKVESPSAWDNIRTLIPQPDIEDPWNSAFYFNAYNRDKRSLTLDLAQQAGRELLLRLVAHCDVVIENYRADVLDKLGLGYDELRKHRADIVLVSMAAFGKTGADRQFVGFGPVIEMMSGLCSLSGYGDGEPFKTGISYGDPIAGTFAVAATTLALARRDRTGNGVHIDLAQRETAAALAGEAFVACGRGEPFVVDGNRDPRYVPQGCYRVAGDDRWIVISAGSDEQWSALASLIGAPELAALTTTERRVRHDELDARIATWTAGMDGRNAWDALQAVGVPACPVLDTRDLLEDPHLAARGFWHSLAHPKMHPYRQQGVVWRFEQAAPKPKRHSPLFGEHNHELLCGLLGLSNTDLDDLAHNFVIAQAPRNPGVG